MFISSIFYYQIRVRVLSQEMATDTPQSAPAGVFLYKYGCLCPAVNFHWGIFVQIWVPMPRSQLSPGYFCANMGVCTPQPTFTGVFLCKYGRLYPAANFYRGISTQIWVPVPRSQLSPGYFRTNTGAYTPQSAFTGVFSRKYGYLYPRHTCPSQKLPPPSLQKHHISSIPM